MSTHSKNRDSKSLYLDQSCNRSEQSENGADLLSKGKRWREEGLVTAPVIVVVAEQFGGIAQTL